MFCMKEYTVPGHDGVGSLSGHAWRYSLGRFENIALKHCEKYDNELNPHATETSRTDIFVLVSKMRAYCNLKSFEN